MHKTSPVVVVPEALTAAAVRAGLTRTVNGKERICQSSMARRLGVSQSTISRALRGSPVSAPLIAAVVEHLPVVYGEVFRPKAAA